MTTIDQAIEGSKKITALLEEYKTAKEYERFEYVIDQIEFRPASTRERFGVIRKSDGKILHYDILSECERYCRKRNIEAFLIPPNTRRQ